MINRLLLIFLFTAAIIFPQAGTYYDSLNPSTSSFISDLETRIRVPYTQVSYDNFDESNVTYFASRDTTGGQRVVTCVYSGENYVYTPPFAWGHFSREHTWCQSWMPSGGSTSSQEGSDQHHIFPVNQNQVNGIRSNHPLGNVVSVTGTYLGAKIGTNSTGNIVYEPRPTHKGDAARALLYMAIKYDGVGGYSWSFNTLQTYLAAHSEGPQDLATLIAWHKQDPPDKWEIDRNNYVQSIQQNRNPFVDHPEWVNYINFNDLTKLTPVYSAEPTNYPTNLSVSSGAGLTINWRDAVPGSQAPSGYLLIAYDYNNYFLPIDGESYTNDTDLSDGKAIVNIPFSDPDTYTFTGLTSNKKYYFTLISYNGTGTSINYKINGPLPQASGIYNATPVFEPTVQTSNIVFSKITSEGMTLHFTPGNGSSRIILVHQSSNVDADPVDGNTYTSNSIFGGGTQIGTGNYTLYKGSGDSVVVTGLNPSTTYYYKIYEFNGSDGSENYLTTAPAASSSTTNAVTRPTIQSSALGFSSVGSTSMTLGWKPGNGTSRIVIARSGSSVNQVPLDAALYTAGSAFGSGTDLGSGNYVVYMGSGDTVTVSGLTPVTTYYFSVFEFNGPGGQEQFLTTSPSSGNQTTSETNHLIISEVYGGGGVNSSSTYKYDYIILYNPSSSPVSLTGWSVQYASATGSSFTSKTSLSGTANANSYFVIREHSSGTYGLDLPYVDFSTGNIDLSGTNGRVALSRNTTTIAGINDPNVVDYIGYGTAIEFEGSSAAPAASVTTSVRRKLGGTQDSDDNANDFVSNTLASSPPLAVELESFSAAVSGRTVSLHWKTATEKNNSFFEVQRSNDNYPDGSWIAVSRFEGLHISNAPKEYSAIDKNLPSGKYYYRLKIVDRNGNFEYSGIISAVLALPERIELFQNYPNPFNPTTKIEYSLPYSTQVRLVLYDALGNLVQVLENGSKESGYHEIIFNGSGFSSGIYFYELTISGKGDTRGFRSVRKLILLK